ncbi:breast carcinoma-amplified sequence 1 isoform X1 [Dunckerocampus dactyliophorus]|uniref:breast carcinoma-amplified sequence 1 isoform X1 n=1 Tax=Dunckerocampus dactyliophorus TaxID=161453 RepID=UPI00240595C6|nr:breast carcinoma-amplified sequence 1 isoform X1 [Dunckerocampus dactyliophorus]XP_054649117.1 breast carcinoma-amplified sequence 1 isoform X1 [Dunckerocampus dactyliophorus]XP_054649118.1 breast carcinoma-amplified sequence 1 isoform X1 [Dunckerocampus dactyliophorus]XP_054649119.1 breast carcinoma-amplified sequence 1 isoform X1 [Dunckerocampus dactyliophorus]XP_054649126.1 breast carcinoma-amplified sequence 1 isoform X1 [Dunckerocampus dactyliophorus]XP_054649135.1 breast carcinoma-amp
MGNEHSKSKDPSKDEKNHPSHENGGVNGLTVNITSNELDIDINRDTTVQPNGKAAAAEPLQEHDLVMVSSEGQPVEALPASPEAEQPKDEKVHLFDKLFKKKAEPEATVNAENVDEEERQNDEIDISHPDAHTELESNLSGEEAVATFEPKEESDCPHHKAETSTQTDRLNDADIWTQTGDEEDAALTNMVDASEPSREPSDYDIVIAEEAVEESSQEESLGNQAAGIIIEEITLENVIYENIVFRAEKVVVTNDGDVRNPEKTDAESITEVAQEVKVEDGEPPSETLLTETEHDVVMRDIREGNVITVMETISEEEEHFILETTESTVHEDVSDIAVGDLVREQPLERCDACKELSTIDEVPEDHFDEFVSQLTSTDSTADGNKTAKEIQVEAVDTLSQNPESQEPSTDSHLEVIHSEESRQKETETVLESVAEDTPVQESPSESHHKIPAIPSEQNIMLAQDKESTQKEVQGSADEDTPTIQVSVAEGSEGAECSKTLNGIPDNSEPHVDIFIPAKGEIHCEKSTQKENESVLESVTEDTPAQEFSSECEAVVDVPCSESRHKIPPIPTEETIILAQDEESIQKKVQGSADEYTHNQKSSVECEFTFAEIPPIRESPVEEITIPAEDETRYEDCKYKESDRTIQVSVADGSEDAECSATLNAIPDNSEPHVEIFIPAKGEIHCEDSTQKETESVLESVTEDTPAQESSSESEAVVNVPCSESCHKVPATSTEETINPPQDEESTQKKVQGSADEDTHNQKSSAECEFTERSEGIVAEAECSKLLAEIPTILEPHAEDETHYEDCKQKESDHTIRVSVAEGSEDTECSATLNGIPDNSEPRIEIFTPAKGKVHCEESTQKKTEAVLESVDEDTPAQELSSECEAVVDVPCSESHHKIPAIPTEQTIIPDEDEESTQKKVQGSANEDTPNHKLSAECEFTERSEGIVAEAECSEQLTEIPTILEPPAENEAHYEDCKQKESDYTIRVSVAEVSEDAECSARLNGIPDNSEPRIEIFTPAKGKVHCEESTQKKTEAVLESVAEDTPAQELSSECEAVVDVPCSESHHKIPAIPTEQNIISAEDEESTQKKVQGSANEDTPNQKSSAECEFTERSEGIVAETECSEQVAESPTILEPPAEDESHYEDCKEKELDHTIRISVAKLSEDVECSATLSSEPYVEIVIPAKGEIHCEESAGEDSTEHQISESYKAQISKDNPATSDAPEEDQASPRDEGVAAVEPVVEAISENLALCEIMNTECCVLQAESPTEEELVSCSLEQEEPVEENMDQPTRTENTVLEEPNNCDNCLAASECLRTVIEGVFGKINPADTSEAGGEVRPTDDSSDLNPEHQEHIDAILVGLQSSCTSIIEESSYRLDGLEISSSGCKITIVLQVSPLEEQQ